MLWDLSRTEAGRELITGDTGQGVIREIVQDYMTCIAWDDSGYPVELELRHWLPSKVTVDVHTAAERLLDLSKWVGPLRAASISA